MSLIELFQNQLLNVVAWIFIFYVIITLILEMLKRLWKRYGGLLRDEDSSNSVNGESRNDTTK
jgi:hypothetical protein